MNDTRDIVELIEQKIKEVDDQDKPGRSERISIEGVFKQLHVIRLGVNQVKLNPKNHRLSAQIEDGKLGETIQDPYSTKSQKTIAGLLAETDHFDELKEELKELGQRDPGLITRDGVLINGNTRCAALKILHEEGIASASGIDVAVLPQSLSEEAIPDIEMDHQMLKLTHQEYSFTNRLLFMERYRKFKEADQPLATAMGWRRQGVKKVQQHMRMLGYIKEIREINPSIKYESFNNMETALKDLDVSIQSLMNEGDAKGAADLKYQRLIALMMGLNKDQVRVIDLEFFEKLIEDSLASETELKPLLEKYLPKHTTPDSDFDDDEDEPILNYNALFQSYLSNVNVSPEGGDDNDEGSEFDALKATLNAETDRKISEERQESRGQELSLTMRGIRENISSISAKLPERIKEKNFKPGDFSYEIKKAMNELDHLEKEFERFRQ